MENYYDVEGIMVEDMQPLPMADDGEVTVRSSPVGQKFRVCASKTHEEALSMTNSAPETLFFPTDTDGIVFGGREYGVKTYPGLLTINGVDMNHVPARIDFYAICSSEASSSTKEISLISKDGKSHANVNYPRVLVVKFRNGNTYQGRTVYLDINAGELKFRMGASRAFPILPPDSALILACHGSSQWDIVGRYPTHYEIGDVMSLASTPTSEQLDSLFGVHDGTSDHPLMLAINGGCTIVSKSSFGRITVTGWTDGQIVGVNFQFKDTARCIYATNSAEGWTSPSFASYDLSSLKTI